MRNAIIVLVGGVVLATLSIAMTEQPTAQAQPASVPVPADDFTSAPVDRTDEVLDAVGRLSDRLDTILDTLDAFERRIAALEGDVLVLKAGPTRATTAACVCETCDCDPCQCGGQASQVVAASQPKAVEYMQVCSGGVCQLVPVESSSVSSVPVVYASGSTSSYSVASDCYDCEPAFPVLGAPVRLVGRVIGNIRENRAAVRSLRQERRAARWGW